MAQNGEINGIGRDTGKAMIERTGNPTIFLLKQTDAPIPSGILLHQRGGPIFRPVVYDQQFPPVKVCARTLLIVCFRKSSLL